MSGTSSQPTYASAQFNTYTLAFEGISLMCILTGAYLAITGMNIYLLRKKRYRILLLYSIIQLAFTTLYCTITIFTAPTRTLGVFYLSSGPGAFPLWANVTINVAFILNTWVSDAFLLYRCYVICLGNRYALALPVLLYLATIGSSLAWLVVSSTPGNYYSLYAVQLADICYWSCSTAMNVCTSCLISVRLWMHRRLISKVLGSQRGAFYLGYIAMTLESTLLYTAFAIVVLVVCSLNSLLELLFVPVLGIIQAIAPSLIVYRIARGISFGTDEYGSMEMGNVHFASAD